MTLDRSTVRPAPGGDPTTRRFVTNLADPRRPEQMFVDAAMPPGLDPSTRRRVLCDLAGSAVDHGPFRSVSALIESQVDRTPARRAVSFADQSLTYRELDESANALSARLADAGVGRGDVVPVVMVNCLDLPVAYLAVLKLGAAFVPCDPGWPLERLRRVLTALNPRIVLAAADDLPIAVPVLSPRDRQRSADRPVEIIEEADLAYGVFTSGTTGLPKCAMNTQRGLVNRLRFMSRYFHADGSEVVLQNSRQTFDSSIWQLLWPLTSGGCTVIPEQGEFLDLERTIQTIGTHAVTITDFVPATLAMMVALLDDDPAAVAQVRSLRYLVVGGEEIGPSAVHRMRALVPGLEICNGYGPSETAIGMVFHQVTAADGDHVPLGRPIDNCYVLVLDEQLELLAPGEVGEIVIGGACVGAGYLYDPDRTALAFVPNPYAEIPSTTLYRTGDLGWFDERGELRLVGRVDRQIKIAGVRIELGEVEAAAEACAGVRQAKALAVGRTAGRKLVVAASGDDVTAAAVRTHLTSVLPRTSLPHHVLVFADLPLADSGKVDLNGLQRLVEHRLAVPAQRATDEAPHRRGHRSDANPVLQVLRDVLEHPGLNADDDLMDSGCDSLRALTCVIRLRTATGVDVGVHDLYRLRTPAALAAELASRPPGRRREEAEEQALMARDLSLAAGLTFPVVAGAPAAVPRRVFLTGVTGFVGARVAYELLARTDVEIDCLVRARNSAQARARAIAVLQEQHLWRPEFADRLAGYAGDLGAAGLGLAPAHWDTVAAECDAIMHVGAMVNFLFDYRTHRGANVLGTLEILRLALDGRPKTVHHVSTLGVLGELGCADGDFGLAGAAPPVSACGYSRSKWVAEGLVADAARRGVCATIYRLGEVMPATDNGLPNTKALTHLLLTAFQRLGMCPDVEIRSDYTPVDDVASRLVAGLGDEQIRGQALHVYHGSSVSMTSVLGMGGLPVRRVAEAEFLAALDSAAADPDVPEAAQLLAMLAPAGGCGVRFEGLLADSPRLYPRPAALAFERRHGLTDAPLQPAIAAYVGRLADDGALTGLAAG
jgi:amino acid adenylation domain-containing protein/thioester reductase-like protein